MSSLDADVDDRSSQAVNESLTTKSHAISLEEAEQLARSRYGIEGRASQLTSERDQNFKIAALDGRTYALRVSNPAEDWLVTDFQMRALLHIEKVDPELPVPRVIRTLDEKVHFSEAFGDDPPRSVRLLSYLPGVPLNTVERTSAQRRSLGAWAGRLSLALRGFFHQAADHDLAWDIKNASRLRELLKHIPEADRRHLAEHFLNNFEHNAAPKLTRLRAQVVHNDLNAFNVLVDAENHDTIAGILDFGDMVHTSLVNDVAVGASYQLSSEKPWETAAEFISAYHAVSPLERQEIELLYDLIATRFVVTVAITGWRAARYPENSAYILKNNGMSWAGLQYLIKLPREQAQRQLLNACEME